MQTISLIEVPLSLAVNYFLVVYMDMQYLGAALSLTVGNGIDLLLMLIYVIGSGKSSTFLALPTRRALQVTDMRLIRLSGLTMASPLTIPWQDHRPTLFIISPFSSSGMGQPRSLVMASLLHEVR